MTKKPEGLKTFDDLCRKLVNVTPAKSPTHWAIWRLYPDKPGCVDYLGSVDAASRAKTFDGVAEAMAEQWGAVAA